jgi:hypothetical protein
MPEAMHEPIRQELWCQGQADGGWNDCKLIEQASFFILNKFIQIISSGGIG